MLNVFSIYENWSVYIGRTGVQGSRKSFATCDSSDNRPPATPPARNAARHTRRPNRTSQVRARKLRRTNLAGIKLASIQLARLIRIANPRSDPTRPTIRTSVSTCIPTASRGTPRSSRRRSCRRGTPTSAAHRRRRWQACTCCSCRPHTGPEWGCRRHQEPACRGW